MTKVLIANETFKIIQTFIRRIGDSVQKVHVFFVGWRIGVGFPRSKQLLIFAHESNGQPMSNRAGAGIGGNGLIGKFKLVTRGFMNFELTLRWNNALLLDSSAVWNTPRKTRPLYSQVGRNLGKTQFFKNFNKFSRRLNWLAWLKVWKSGYWKNSYIR